jgi:predicted acyltransferase
MFLVNVAGRDQAFPEWFAHRGWNGGKMGNGLADFVFPWFLFIVGAAVPFSMNSGRGRGQPVWRRLLSALRRGVTLYLLGTLLWCATIAYDKPITLDVFLHWDILPLIGFGYVVAVVLALFPRWVQAAFVVAVCAGKVVLLNVLSGPGEGAAAPFWPLDANAQSQLRASLGWTGTMVTQGLPAAAATVLGALTGDWLRASPVVPLRRAAWLLCAGVVLAAVGWAGHAFGGHPFSKDFFTATYVLYMTGTAAAVLAVFYALIDAAKATTLVPLRVLGMNALAIYILAEFLWKTALMKWKVTTPDGSGALAITAAKAWWQLLARETAGSWLLVASYIAAYWCVAWVLHRKRIYVKV